MKDELFNKVSTMLIITSATLKSHCKNAKFAKNEPSVKSFRTNVNRAANSVLVLAADIHAALVRKENENLECLEPIRLLIQEIEAVTRSLASSTSQEVPVDYIYVTSHLRCFEIKLKEILTDIRRND